MVPSSPRVVWLQALLVAGVLAAAVHLWIGAAVVPFQGHGERFATMAQAPLAFDGEIPHRVLWPVLAHGLGWLGLGPVGCSHLANMVLLLVVAWFVRLRVDSLLDAALVTATVAAGGGVLVYHMPMACYSDTLNLALLALTVHFATRPAVFWSLVLLAALSHEMVLFFTPWLLWLRHRSGGLGMRDAAWFLGVLLVYGGYRVMVSGLAPATGPSYGFLYYILNNFWVPWLLPGLWALLVQVVLAEFGPLLVLAFAGWRADETGSGGRVGALLYLGCLLSLELFAYDVMRFASFLFLPVLLGGLAVVRLRHGRWLVLALLVAAVVAYSNEHPVPSMQGGVTFTRLQGEMMELVGPHVHNNEISSANAFAMQRQAFGLQWTTWVWVVAAWLACGIVGVWLGRRGLAQSHANDAGNTPRTQRNASP